jgi:PAS domain S-box-containing protein
MSGMALDWRLTLTWTLLSVVAVSAFAIAEFQGVLPSPAARSPGEMWIVYLFHIGAVVWLVSYSAGAFRGVLWNLGRRSAALAESEARYAQLVEQSPDVIVVLDGDGRVVECSAAIETVYGYAPDEVLGRTFRELGVIPGELLEQNMDSFRSMLTDDRSQLAASQVLHRDGSIRWAESNSRIVHTADGTVRLHLVIRDVTARVEADRLRDSLERQLVEARRLEALGRMAGGLAHDFNNLLLVILSNTEMLETDQSKPSEPLLGEIRLAGEAAAELTAQLLAFSGQQVHEVGSVDVSTSLNTIDSLLSRLLHPNVLLEIRCDDDLPHACGDPAPFEQAIMNLVMNAQNAMPDGGRISIEASHLDVTPAECQHHSGAAPGPHVRIAVDDTGCGMNEETASHIFEPFYSERSGGTGLGLATVHGTTTQCGGHVRVDSRLGVGTRFEVYLPVASAEGSAAAQPVPGRAVSRDEEVVVLLVDDEPAVLSAVSLLLESRGIRVLKADSLETARAASEHEPGRIDLLLTDVLMPGTPGPRLAGDLVAARPEMKVLLMSGYTESGIEISDDTLGPAYFIAKPFTGDAIETKIREVLRGSDASGARLAAAHQPAAPV